MACSVFAVVGRVDVGDDLLTQEESLALDTLGGRDSWARRLLVFTWYESVSASHY